VLGAVKAWRFWSAVIPRCIQAMYSGVDQARGAPHRSEVNKENWFARIRPCLARGDAYAEILVLAEEIAAG